MKSKITVQNRKSHNTLCVVSEDFKFSSRFISLSSIFNLY